MRHTLLQKHGHVFVLQFVFARETTVNTSAHEVLTTRREKQQSTRPHSKWPAAQDLLLVDPTDTHYREAIA